MFSCEPDDGNSQDDYFDGFDRQGMLINWVDNNITPAYSDFYNSLENLHELTLEFNASPNILLGVDGFTFLCNIPSINSLLAGLSPLTPVAGTDLNCLLS